MYEEALESLHHDNAKAEATIRMLRDEIENLENAKRDMEDQHAELPALEFISSEIRALKSAVQILRQQNVEYRAREGLKRLRDLLVPLREDDGYIYEGGQQAQKRREEREALMKKVKRQQAELKNTLRDIKTMKATTRVIDLTLEAQRREAEEKVVVEGKKGKERVSKKQQGAEGELSAAQQWAAKKVEVARLQRRCEELTEGMKQLWMEAEPGTKAASDFASFPSVALTKRVQQSKPVQVGRLSVPTITTPTATSTTSTTTAKEMKDLLASLRGGATSSGTSRVVFNTQQLAKVHSLLLPSSLCH